MNESFDVVIVGAGAAGAVVAYNLSKHKELRILCIEQGPYLSPDSFVTNFNDWELSKYSSFNPDPNLRQSAWDTFVENGNSDIHVANFNAMGGSTILFSGHYPRMHVSDFKVKTNDNVGSDWPIDYFTLEKYYDKVQTELAVAGVDGDPAYPPISNLLPPVPLGIMGEKLAQSFNSLGWHWWPSYSAIATRKFKNQNKCQNLGSCNVGCPFGSKSSTDITHIPYAMENGVEFRTLCRVSRILTSSQGNIAGVEYFDKNKQKNFIETSRVVLAAGGIGTPRILLNSKSKCHKFGLGNENDLVGRNLMLHPLGYAEGVFNEYLASNLGPQGCLISSQHFIEPPKNAEFHRGFTMQALRGPGLLEFVRNQLNRNQMSWGQEHHSKIKDEFNHTAHLAIIVEDLPEKSNRVLLSESKSDAFGIPIPEIDYKLSTNSRKLLAFGLKKGQEVLRNAGAKKVFAFGPVRNAGWHIMGTARMGNNPSSSVTNSSGEVHSCNNLFVADSSLFVTSGSVNPAATVQALASYISDQIVYKMYKEGLIKNVIN